MYFAPYMQYVRSIGTVAFAGILLSTLPGCRKDAGPARWDIDVALPLFTTQLTIGDLIPDSLLAVGADGTVSLVYTSALFAVDLDTLLGLPDTSFIYAYAFPLPGNDQFNLPAGFPVISQNNVLRFDLPQVQLSRLDIRSGELQVDMRNKITSRVLGHFEIPSGQFPDGVNALDMAVDPGTPSAPAMATLIRDLSGTRFDLRGPTYNQVNTLTTNVAATLDPDGSGATVTNQDSVVVQVGYNALITAYAKGYFGTNTISQEEEESRLTLFDRFVAGSLDLDQVTMRLHVENGVGMDIQVRLNTFQAVNSRTGVTVDLQNALLQGPINLNRATDLGNGFTPSHYLRTLDNSNSNIDAFVENLPDRVRYGVEILLNPLGNISNGNDFLYYESELKADLELEVPLSIIASGLTLENFSRPDLPGDAENPALDRGTLHLLATNGFPFDARVVLELVDEENTLLSTIEVDGAVRAGNIGPNGLVSSVTRSTLHAPLDAFQVDLLYAGARLRTRVVFDTDADLGHVRVLDSYALDLQVTVDGNYIVNGQ